MMDPQPDEPHQPDEPEQAGEPGQSGGESRSHAEGEADERPDGEAPRTLADMKPWEGRAGRTDKVLLGFMIGVPIFYLVMWPLRPFLIAQAPLILELVTGAKTVIAAAGAYAGIGERPLLLVILAGWIGMSKIDWLFWLAGNRWGPRVLRLFASGPSQQKWTARLQAMPSWLLAILVFIGRFPGIPGVLVWLIAGLSGMRFRLFITMNLLGNLTLTVAMAMLGYALGERAVTVIETIDRYALWVSLGLIFVLVFWQSWRASKQQKAAAQKAVAQKPEGRADAGRPTEAADSATEAADDVEQ